MSDMLQLVVEPRARLIGDRGSSPTVREGVRGIE